MAYGFKDPLISDALDTKGFAIVPFASAEQVNELKEFYTHLPPTQAKGTHVTMFHPQFDYRKKVDDKLRALLETRALDFMYRYRVLFTNMMVKEPGPEGDFPVHQDWTYVDETQHTSYAFWIPLQDVSATNGALQVVPGSHRLLTRLRGPYIQEPFQHLSQLVREKYAEPVALKAGEALVWDHRLIHFSLPNLTAQARLACTLIVVPEEVEVMHCFGVKKGDADLVEIYQATSDFYLRYTIGKRPEGIALKKTMLQPHLQFDQATWMAKLIAPMA